MKIKLWYRVRTSLVGVLRVLLAVALCVVSFCAVASAAVQAVVLNPDTYTAYTQRAAFREQMKTYAYTALEDEFLYYNFPLSLCETMLPSSTIDAFAYDYGAAIYRAIATDEGLKTPQLDARPFIHAVEQFYATLPEDERPTDEDAAAVGNDLANVMQIVLDAGMLSKVVNYADDIIPQPLLHMFADTVWVWIAVAVVLGVVLIALNRKKKVYQLYLTVFACHIGTALFFVPVWLLHRYSLTSRLSVGPSPMKLYLEGIVTSVTEGLQTVALYPLVITALLTVVAVVWFLCLDRRVKTTIDETEKIPYNGQDQ